jgi:hypothetical protein
VAHFECPATAEPLLIHAHNPVFNSKYVYNISEEKVGYYYLHNWNTFRDLFPEVSGKRYSSKFENITKKDIYVLR